MHDRVEVLSFAYEHLYLADWRDAIGDVFVGRAEVLEEHESKRIGTAGGSIPFPKVVRFKTGLTASKLCNRLTMRFSKETLFARDAGTCQYCQKELTRQCSTIDHIIPRSKGGNTNWENCVICCPGCNSKKGNKTLIEAGMDLFRIPGKPKSQQIQRVKR